MLPLPPAPDESFVVYSHLWVENLLWRALHGGDLSRLEPPLLDYLRHYASPGATALSPAVPLTEVVQEAPGGGDDASGAADSIGGGADRGSGQAGQDRDGVGGRVARMAA